MDNNNNSNNDYRYDEDDYYDDNVNNYNNDLESDEPEPFTDSSTSSVSESNSSMNGELEEIDLGIDQTQLKEQLVQPIKSKSFVSKITNQTIEDNFELALLRWIHLIFSTDNLIIFSNLNKYMDMNNQLCLELNDFFIDNPVVMLDSDFYYSDTGIIYREKWFELLSNRNFFNYKNTDTNIRIGIYPSIENFYKFLENFFPKLTFEKENQNDQIKLDIIYSKLNFHFDSLKLVYATYRSIENGMIHSCSIQNIIINNIHSPLFVWENMSIKEINNTNLNSNTNEIFSDSELRYY